MELLVVGAGAMGRWVARSVDATVTFADADPSAAADAARELGGGTAPPDGDEAFDAVCLAVPMPAVEDAVATHARRADRAVFDVAGEMATPVRAMREHAADLERVSLHPLFSPENAPGNVAVVPDAPGDVTDAVLDDLRGAGNHLFETTPAEHDEAMETVQASAHAAVLAYALAARTVREEFGTPVSDGMDDLVASVTGGTPRVYSDIQETFPGAERVADAARRIADADPEAFERLYRAAGRDAADPTDHGSDAAETDHGPPDDT
jgi:prephenate dehydrogenase